MDSDSRSGLVLGLSLVEVMLLLAFAAMMVSVTDSVEGKGQDARPIVEEAQQGDRELQAKLDAAAEKSRGLEQQLSEMSRMVNEVKLMVGAKGSTKEGFQEAKMTSSAGMPCVRRTAIR